MSDIITLELLGLQKSLSTQNFPLSVPYNMKNKSGPGNGTGDQNIAKYFGK